MFCLFLIFSASSVKEVKGVQTGPVCVGTDSDYKIHDCFMESIKNDNGLCHALYFVGNYANFPFNLYVENTVFSLPDEPHLILSNI